VTLENMTSLQQLVGIYVTLHAVTEIGKGLFSWQNFWRNATVAVSLLFGKYCLIIV
jgi:hypothetical protein